MPRLQRILTGGIFSGSNQSGAASAQALSRSGAIFGNTSRVVQGDERIALAAAAEEAKAARFDRAQTFTEGAPARARDEEQRLFDLNRTRTAADNQIVTDTLNDPSNQFAQRQQTTDAILNTPGFQNLSKGVTMTNPDNTRQGAGRAGLFTPEGLEVNKRRGEILNGFIQNMRTNPNLHADPDQLTAQVAAKGRAAGLDAATIAQLQGQVLESFKVLNPKTADALFKQNTADGNNIAKILAAYAGRSSSTNNSTGSTGSGLKGTNKGPNQLQNKQAIQDYLNRTGTNNESGIVTAMFDVLPNLVNNVNVDSQRLHKMIAASQANSGGEVGADAIISAMQSLNVIREDGTIGPGPGNFYPKNEDEIIGDENIQNQIIQTAKEFQNAGRGGQGDGTTAVDRLTDALSLFKASAGDNNNQLNNILSQLTPRQQTGNERAQLGRDFVADITGVKSASSIFENKPPTKKDKKVVTDNIISVDTDTITEDKIPTPTDPIFDNSFEEDINNPVVPDPNLNNSFRDEELIPANIDDNGFIEDRQSKIPGSGPTNRGKSSFKNEPTIKSNSGIFSGIQNTIDESFETVQSNVNAATKKADKAFNDPRMKTLGISSNSNMKDSGVREIVQNDYESNFYHFTPDERLKWFRVNQKGLGSDQKNEAKAIIAADKEAAKPRTLQEILNQ